MSDVVIKPHSEGPYQIKGNFKIVTDGDREIAFDRDEARPFGEQAILQRLTQEGRLQEQPGREVVTAT
jgi:hypothetical protein